MESNEQVPPDKTASYINEYFAEIGNKLARNLDQPWTTEKETPDTNFTLHDCTLQDLLPLIRKINIHKSSGVDKIASRILKDTFLTLPEHLRHIINLIIRTNIFPDSWKSAVVSPIPKGGDSSDVNNLRPISILPLPAKLAEKIIHKQILDYLTDHNLLTDSQDGFRPGRSTTDSLEKLTEHIYNNYNNQNCTSAIFLDFRKAFDTLNHDILIKKMKIMGFGPNTLALIKNYLTNRTQKTKVNNTLSGEYPITCGVPQGSVLGPLLFVLYINDMSECLNTLRCQHYADDTVIFIAHEPQHDVSDVINEDLRSIENWCNRNKLSLNGKKTKLLTFTTKALNRTLVRPRLWLQGEKIEHAPTYKYLGITLDTMMKFSKQVNNLEKNAKHKLYLLKNIRYDMDVIASEKVFKTMLIPTIEYGDIFYGVASKTNLNKIQVVVNKALKTVYKKRHLTSSAILHRKAKFNRLKDRRDMKLHAAAFKASMQDTNLDVRPIFTRHRDARLLKQKRPRNPAYEKSLEYRKACCWNALGIQTRKIKGEKEFEKWMKETLEQRLAAYI